MLKYVHQAVSDCVCLRFDLECGFFERWEPTKTVTLWAVQLKNEVKLALNLGMVEGCAAL